MAEVTREEFTELRTMVEETYWMARGAVQSVTGKKHADALADSVKRHCDPFERKWNSATALFRLGLPDQNSRPWNSLSEAGIVTLEDVASRPKSELAALPGVGGEHWQCSPRRWPSTA